MLLQLAKDLGNLIYPPVCLSCHALGVEPDSPFCRECSTAFTSLSSHPACPKCGVPIPDGSACPHCNGDGIYPLERIVALGAFREPLRKLVHEMKYRHRWPVAEILAERMLAEPRIRRVLDEADVLVPIPLHWQRQIVRGYNQADALARRLARLAGNRRSLKVARPIVRLKNTSAQTTVRSVADRVANVRFAFGLIDPKSVRDKRVVLVDDVRTTGSTLKAAARTLVEAEPAGIDAVVVAVADPGRRDFEMT